uniref:Uncharacterized protein n=1 Tax=Canis lupus familiaris TaxID=9615 RepID=A0A8C0Z6R8_CANLF
VRIGDHHGVFHAFCCGNGHLLVRLPTKESVKRQRVGQVERPAMRRVELLQYRGGEGRYRCAGNPGDGACNGAPLGTAARQGPAQRRITRLQRQVLGCSRDPGGSAD